MRIKNIKTSPEEQNKGEGTFVLGFDLHDADDNFMLRIRWVDGITQPNLMVEMSPEFRMRGSKRISPELDVDETFLVTPDSRAEEIRKLKKAVLDSHEWGAEIMKSLASVIPGLVDKTPEE